ncbi:MAG: calcium/sodium antiporter [Methyloligellaceae bacterium]
MLAAGIALLLLCGDILVRGSVALAVRLGIPSLVIGLTIVAFGTSAPELVVSLRAALSGAPGIAIGNVVGSNIANVLLVLGLPALISATDCNQPFIKRNTLYVVGASLIFIGLCYAGPLSFWHGALLFALMVAFLIESGRRAAQRSVEARSISNETIELIDGVSGLPGRVWAVSGFIAAGLIGLPLGAHLTVSAATEIAGEFGISRAAIGLTVVALGTSLPELATTVSAAFRGHCGLAIGNVLGSNLFNILAIMGLTAMVAPVPVPDIMVRVDLWVMLAAALAITPFVIGRWNITRTSGLIFVSCYLLYIAFVFMPRADVLASLARP